MSIANLVVVNTPSRWNFPVDSVQVIAARDYLAPSLTQQYPQARVFNLCRSYQYQSLGYYVSLLAEARGHTIIPAVTTLRDFRSMAIARSFGEEIDDCIQTALADETGEKFVLAIYFGQTLDRRFARLGAEIYRLFPAPLLRAQFVRQGRWLLNSVNPLAVSQLPMEEREQISAFAVRYFNKKHKINRSAKQRILYDMAILVNPAEDQPPSDAEALAKFKKAAREVGFYVETITAADAARVVEFDALFLRETTAVDHPTYRISRLAHAEGLVVIDDPWSILRCANKIFLAESLSRARLPAPRTWVLTRDDLEPDRLSALPLPCILKLPDEAFSRGVVKVNSLEELRQKLEQMLEGSELILAQEFVPSEYDWRIGVLDHQPLFACKYFMAADHWQIYNWNARNSKQLTGRWETLHIEFAPPLVVDTALKAARLAGDSLYGVDLKQVGDRVMVIEVNDNPNIEAGVEDAALGLELYRRIARSFRRRIEQARG